MEDGIKILAAASGPEKGLWGNKALKRWQAVLEMDPNHWDARYSLAFSMSQYPDFMNMTGEAIAEYERVLELAPNMSKAKLNLMALMPLKGQGRGDVKKYERALAKNPDDPDVHGLLGIALLRESREDEAREHFLEAIRLEANHPDAHAQLGLLALFDGDFPEAEEHFALLALIQPDDTDHHTNLGVALAEQGRLEEARSAFTQALKADPENESALGAIGFIDQSLANDGS